MKINCTATRAVFFT